MVGDLQICCWKESLWHDCRVGYFHFGVKDSDTNLKRRQLSFDLRGGGISIIKTHLNACISMPPIRLFLFLANSFTFLPFSQSFLIASDRHIQFCYSPFKTHTMPHSPSSIVDFVDDNSQDGANIDTRAFPSDPSSSNTSTARVIQETDDLIRVAVLGTGMMGQVGIRVCNC